MDKFRKASLFFLLLYLFASCNDIKKNKKNIGTIEVLYFKGHMETKNSIKCGTINKKKSSFTVDTTLVEPYDEIVSRVRSLKILEFDTLNSINCDIRMQCKVNCENGDSIKLCIGVFNCIIKDEKVMVKDDSLLYLIRKHSGYYNYFFRDELTYFDELGRFGIPDNYKELRRRNKSDGIPLPPQ